MSLIASGSTLWTFQDVIEHLADGHDVTRTGKNQRDARRAVLQAYRELPQKHSWNYYQRQRLLQTSAVYSTGTIAVDVTGGAHERMVTLSDGTWPTWAALGRLIIDGVHYEVKSRESSTIITLEPNSYPTSDVASGTAYQIYQSGYLLPADFKRLLRLWDVDGNYEIIQSLPQSQHLGLVSYDDTPGDPRHCTIRGQSDYYGRMFLQFGPPPSSERTYEMFYEATPQPLTLDYYSTGTVTLTADSATVTGNGTTFPVDAITAGTILRVSSSATAPTSIHGNLSGVDNPFSEQYVVKSRDSATQLTLESAATVSRTTVAYTLSSPIDIEPNAMYTAFLNMAEAEYARRKQDPQWQRFLPAVKQSLIESLENDNRLASLNGNSYYDPFRNVTTSQE